MKNRLLEAKKLLLYNARTSPRTVEEIIELVNAKDKVNYSEVSLGKFYETFISWYQGAIEEPENYKQEKVKIVENLINKMAIWFEFKYPQNRIAELIPCYGGRKDKDGTAPGEELMSIEQFYKSLLPKERELLKVPTHQKNVHFDNYGKDYFCVDNEGKIIGIEGDIQSLVPEDKRGIINNQRLIGMYLIEANELFKNKGIFITYPKTAQDRKIDNSEILFFSAHYQYELDVYNGILDSVMAKIIDNGGSIIGPRRGLLFALEFGRNLNFPMLYSHSDLDQNSSDFVNYFVDHSGQNNAPCIIEYFDQYSSLRMLQTSNIKDAQPKKYKSFATQANNGLQLAMVKGTNH